MRSEQQPNRTTCRWPLDQTVVLEEREEMVEEEEVALGVYGCLGLCSRSGFGARNYERHSRWTFCVYCPLAGVVVMEERMECRLSEFGNGIYAAAAAAVVLTWEKESIWVWMIG